MLRPVSLFLGCRYLRAKSNNRFISFIALMSMIGIALGVMVLITVLSVMNGFQKEIRDRMLMVTPHVLVQGWQSNGLPNWQAYAETMTQKDHVLAVAPYIAGQAMLLANQQLQGVYLKGIDLKAGKAIFPLQETLVAGSLDGIEGTSRASIVLGRGLAEQLGATVGDEVTLILPQTSTSIIGVLPKLKRFTVAGIFAVDYLHDSHMAFMSLEQARLIFKLANGSVSGIEARLDDPMRSRLVRQAWQTQFSELMVNDWTNMNRTYFQAVNTERNMMFLILTLIIAVAAFNLVSSLVMLVTEKKHDIAILRALGTSRSTILSVFIIQGLFIGLAGCLLGVIGGIWLSLHVTEVVKFIEQIVSTQFLSRDIYFIDFLPSELRHQDVIQVAVMAFIMSLLATLYPAYRATRILPAEVLRHD